MKFKTKEDIHFGDIRIPKDTTLVLVEKKNKVGYHTPPNIVYGQRPERYSFEMFYCILEGTGIPIQFGFREHQIEVMS